MKESFNIFLKLIDNIYYWFNFEKFPSLANQFFSEIWGGMVLN